MKDFRTGQELVYENGLKGREQLKTLRICKSENDRDEYLLSLIFKTEDYREDSILDLQNAFRKLQHFVILPNEQGLVQLEDTGDKIIISDAKPNAYAFFREYAGIIGCEYPASVQRIRSNFMSLSLYESLVEDGEWFAEIAWRIIEKLQEIVTTNK